MSAGPPLAAGWERVAHPPAIFRRYHFDSYRATRAFLERLAALSEETGLYPDLGFGTTYVNVTVPSTTAGPSPAELDFVDRATALERAVATQV